jgi:hypothetical protein
VYSSTSYPSIRGDRIDEETGELTIMRIDGVPTQSRKRQRPSLVFLLLRRLPGFQRSGASRPTLKKVALDSVPSASIQRDAAGSEFLLQSGVQARPQIVPFDLTVAGRGCFTAPALSISQSKTGTVPQSGWQYSAN